MPWRYLKVEKDCTYLAAVWFLHMVVRILIWGLSFTITVDLLHLPEMELSVIALLMLVTCCLDWCLLILRDRVLNQMIADGQTVHVRDGRDQ